MNSVFELTIFVLLHFLFVGEWLDLGEHDYRIFGSQFSEVERLPIDFSQGVLPKRQDLVL